jgi:hypothetical protein
MSFYYLSRVVYLLALSPIGVWAQLTDGSFKGVVLDPGGDAVSSAAVKVRNEGTGLERATVTDTSGVFLIAGVAPGKYTFTVAAPGFSVFQRSGLTLSVGQTTGLDVRLQIAEVQSGIEVTAGEVTIPVATEGRLSDTLAQAEIASMPLPQRDIFLLPKLSAGATFIPGAANSTKITNSPVITVNGNRYRGNDYVLDGAINVNPNNSGEPAIVPSVESVEEAQVQTSNFSGEYGRGNGSVVNLRTKSGTNDLHGRVWELDRNAAFNARNFFAAKRPPVTFNQFGANVGGAVIKNKTFFFVSYEGARSAIGQALTFQVETPEFRDYAIRANPKSVAARLFQKYPAPTPLAGGGGARYAGQIDLPTAAGVIPAIGSTTVTLMNHAGFDQYLGKLDHSFRDNRDRVSVRWIAEKQRDDGGASSSPATLAKAVRGSRGPFDGDFGNLNLGYTHVFTRAVNDARFSAQIINTRRGNADAVTPDISITGLTMGFGDVFRNSTRLRSYEWRDTMTVERGRHSLRFGFELRRIFKGIQIGPATAGAFAFSSLTEFAADRPFRQSLTVNPASGQPTDYPRYFRLKEFGSFLQDDWRVSSRLNVSLGLRYDYYGVISERDGRLSSIIMGQGATLQERVANASVGRVDRLYPPQRLNFAPRIGLSYDPFGDGKSALRAGYGISYQPHHGQSLAGARAMPPDAISGIIQPGSKIGAQILYDIPVPYNPEFARGLNDRGGVISRPGEPAIRISPWTVNPTVKTQYSQSWFATVQREVARGWIVEAGYTGTRGVNLERIDDINRFAGDLLDGREDRLNPNFGLTYFVTNGVNSIYHAGTIELRRKFASGFSLQTNYRFSKWLDESSDTSTGQFTDNAEPGKGAQNIECLRCERGPSMFDIPHRFSTALLWAAPFGRSRRGLAGALQRNWELSTILTLQSGRPFSVWNGAPSRIVNGVNRGGDYNLDAGGGAVGGGFYDRPNAPATPVDTNFSKSQYLSGLFSPEIFGAPALGSDGTLGRNTYRGSAYRSVDLALSRGFGGLGEGRSLQLRVEAYNVLNNVNLYLPNSDLSLALRPDGTYSQTSLFGKSSQAFEARALQIGLRFIF